METFTAAQLLRRTKSAGGLATARRSERGKQRERRTYVLRGLLRCGVCRRKVAGEMVRKRAYYRCAARTLAPGSAALNCQLGVFLAYASPRGRALIDRELYLPASWTVILG